MKQHEKLIAMLGGKSAVARMLSISPQAVWKWDGVIPYDRLAQLAIATGRSPKNLEALNNVETVWPELKEGAECLIKK